MIESYNAMLKKYTLLRRCEMNIIPPLGTVKVKLLETKAPQKILMIRFESRHSLRADVTIDNRSSFTCEQTVPKIYWRKNIGHKCKETKLLVRFS